MSRGKNKRAKCCDTSGNDRNRWEKSVQRKAERAAQKLTVSFMLAKTFVMTDPAKRW